MFGAKRALDLFVITLMAFWYAQYWSPSPGSISIEWWQSKIIQIIPLDLRFNDLWVELSYNHRDSSIINNSKFHIKINLWIVNAEMVRTMSTAHCTLHIHSISIQIKLKQFRNWIFTFCPFTLGSGPQQWCVWMIGSLSNHWLQINSRNSKTVVILNRSKCLLARFIE